MEAASEIVKISIDKSNKYRRKATLSESFGRMLKKTDYTTYTEGKKRKKEKKTRKKEREWKKSSDSVTKTNQ